MAKLTFTNEFTDGSVLSAADLDTNFTNIETLVNTTKLDSGNFKSDARLPSNKLTNREVFYLAQMQADGSQLVNGSNEAVSGDVVMFDRLPFHRKVTLDVVGYSYSLRGWATGTSAWDFDISIGRFDGPARAWREVTQLVNVSQAALTNPDDGVVGGAALSSKTVEFDPAEPLFVGVQLNQDANVDWFTGNDHYFAVTVAITANLAKW